MYTMGEFKSALCRKDQELVSTIINSEGFVDLRDEHGNSPLFHAVTSDDDIYAVKALIKLGVKLELATDDGITAFMSAIINNSVEAIKLLNDYQANWEAKDKKGATPIHLICLFGGLETIKLIKNLSVNIDMPDFKGETPLHYASIKGNIDAIRVLLGLNANLESTDMKCRTPLYFAARGKKAEAVKDLIKSGCNVEITLDGISGECLQIIKAAQALDKILEEETLTEENIKDISVLSSMEGSINIIISRAKIFDKLSGEKKYIASLREVEEILHKASGDNPISQALNKEIEAVNDKYMGIAEALAAVITGKPMPALHVKEIHSDKTSEIESQISDATETLKGNSFLSFIYDQCYGGGRNIDPAKLDYYRMVADIISGELKFARSEGEGALSLNDALAEVFAIDAEIKLGVIGQILSSIEQATYKAILSDSLKAIITLLKSQVPDSFAETGGTAGALSAGASTNPHFEDSDSGGVSENKDPEPQVLGAAAEDHL